MPELPQPVVNHLSAVAIEAASPAYLRVDVDGNVVDAGGRLETFGLGATVVGEQAEARLDALSGLLEVVTDPFCLPAVEVAPGIHADLHLIGDDDGVWVVLVDKTAWVAERRLAQQLSNDMSLLRGEIDRRARVATGALQPPPPAIERHHASVLTAIVHGLAHVGDTETAEAAIRDAGVVARAVVRAVVDEAGFLQATCGERFTAVFGVLPATASASALAVTASRRLLAAIDELNASRAREARPPLPVSIGITSGEAAFGPLGGRSQPLAGAIGSCVERSPRLAELAEPGSVVIDEATFAGLDDERPSFELGGVGAGPVYVMSKR